MERDLNNVLYYETFKSNQVLKLYALDKNNPRQYEVETIKDYKEIEKLLQTIDSKMKKIKYVSKKDNNDVLISYENTDTSKFDVIFSNINYEDAIRIKDKQQKLEIENKDIDVKKAKRRSKAVMFTSLALAASMILISQISNKKVDIKKDKSNGYTVLDSIPTMKPSKVQPTEIQNLITPVPTVIPTLVPTQVPTQAPTIKPTEVVNSIEDQREIDFGFVESTPIPLDEIEFQSVQILNNAAYEIVKMDNIGTRQINSEIFLDPNAAAAAFKLINHNFDFNEALVSENNAFKGLVFIQQATSAFALTGYDGIRLSPHILDTEKREEVRKVEDMVKDHINGKNNEKAMIDKAKSISKLTSYDTKEIDYVNTSYIASASGNFYKEKGDGEFLSKLQNDLMTEINVYCFESPNKSK